MKKIILAIIACVILAVGCTLGGYYFGVEAKAEEIRGTVAGVWDEAQQSWEEAAPKTGPGAEMPINVNMVQLMANPEKYHGKLVRICGVGWLEFEGNALYMSFEDLKYSFKYSAWIELDESLDYAEAQKLNGQPVIVEGRFDMNSHGHFGMYFGTIRDVTRYQLWPAYKLRDITDTTP